ncbi:Rib/alpha-like domain-containing protein [Actinotignum sp. GS-2025e]|uniref:Rib/alpha-like domain-containing protein n=1 Tax=Actinotignum TaxID=1653174 RepID=UPI002A8298F8|nr:Rib/alpha-like domain-containing protein [Actinotignum timonense]MDY5137816.1 Rib/alpha-like domain-containing protein [Actinotignum timonense]
MTPFRKVAGATLAATLIFFGGTPALADPASPAGAPTAEQANSAKFGGAIAKNFFLIDGLKETEVLDSVKAELTKAGLNADDYNITVDAGAISKANAGSNGPGRTDRVTDIPVTVTKKTPQGNPEAYTVKVFYYTPPFAFQKGSEYPNYNTNHNVGKATVDNPNSYSLSNEEQSRLVDAFAKKNANLGLSREQLSMDNQGNLTITKTEGSDTYSAVVPSSEFVSVIGTVPNILVFLDPASNPKQGQQTSTPIPPVKIPLKADNYDNGKLWGTNSAGGNDSLPNNQQLAGLDLKRDGNAVVISGKYNAGVSNVTGGNRWIGIRTDKANDKSYTQSFSNMFKVRVVPLKQETLIRSLDTEDPFTPDEVKDLIGVDYKNLNPLKYGNDNGLTKQQIHDEVKAKVTKEISVDSMTLDPGTQEFTGTLKTDLGAVSPKLTATIIYYTARIPETTVSDPNNLTPGEQKAIEDKTRELNQLKDTDKVTVGKDGTVTITFNRNGKDLGNKTFKAPTVKPSYPDSKGTSGSTVEVPISTPEDFTFPDGSTFKIDGDAPTGLTVGEDGKITYQIPEGQETGDVTGTVLVTIPGQPEPVRVPFKISVTKPKMAEKITLKDPDITGVVDLDKLTPEEKTKVSDAIKTKNPDLPTDAEITVSDNGTATVTYKDGSSTTFTPDKTVRKLKDNEKVTLKDPELTGVVDLTNLTDPERDQVKGKVKKANPDLTGDITVAKDGTVTVTFPDGSTSNIPAEKTVRKLRDNEKNKINDPEVTGVVDVNKLTDPEREQVKKAVEKKNPDLPKGTKITVSENGTVTVTFPDDSTTQIPAEKTVRQLKDNEKITLKDPEVTGVVDPNNLTPEEQEQVKDKVKKANPDLTGEITVAKDGTVTVTFPDGSTSNIPAEKTVRKLKDNEKNKINDPEVTGVVDPNNLTPEEQDQVKDKVKKANPDLPENTQVTVGKDGTVTVTFPDGSTSNIPADKTVRQLKDNEKIKINDPEITGVVDVNKLTDPEREQVKKAVEKKNPDLPKGTKITVSENGTVTVTFPDDSTTQIPAEKTVRKLKDNEKIKINDPEITGVVDPNNLTPEEQEQVKDKVKKANPDLPENTQVTVGKDGTVTVTFPDGSETQIPADKTVRKLKDNEKNKLNDPEITGVVDPNNLTPEEQDQVKDKVKKANPDLPENTQVTVGKDGTVTVTFPDGSETQIPADKTVRQLKDNEKIKINDPEVTGVVDPNNLTPEEQDQVKDKVKKANPDLPENTQVTVGKDGTVTVTFPDGSETQIPAEKTVKLLTPADNGDADKGNKGDKPDASKPAKVKKVKKLQHTGADVTLGLLAAAAAVAAGGAMAAGRRRR